MRLDNRSKAVHVSGEGLQGSQDAVLDWYRSSGGSVENVADGVVVTYPSREAAEKALARGTDIPGLNGEISAKWHGNGGGEDITVHVGEVEMGDEERERGERDE
jgi:RNA-binding protein 26